MVLPALGGPRRAFVALAGLLWIAAGNVSAEEPLAAPPPLTALPPIQLEIPAGMREKPHDFELSGNTRQIWEEVAKSYGFGVVFDGDYQPLDNIRFRMRAAKFTEAMSALEVATASFLVPVSEKLGLVARETPQKRQELEQQMAISVPLPEPVTVQEAQELARGVQQLMELQKFSVDSVQRLAILRGPPSKVLPAVLLFRQLLQPKPDVVIDVDFIEVSEHDERQLGLQLPNSFPLDWLVKPSSPGEKASNILNLAAFGMRNTYFSLGIGSAEMIAQFAQRSGRVALRSQIRSTSGQAATLHVGDKYPIITNGYYGNTTGTGTVYTPPPTISFEELGLVLKLTPLVHDAHEISFAVDAQFKVLTGTALNGIPVIASRKFESACRLKDGEWGVIAGLIRSSETRSLTGIAGVSTLPWIGRFLSRHDTTKDDGQILLILRPRLVDRVPADGLASVDRFWTGSEGRPRAAY
ncbi:MAG: type II and III secretion system protein [Acidobacteriota bacterium]